MIWKGEALSLISACILTACSLEKEVSRVEIPNSKVSIALTEDEKRMFRYHLLIAGKEVGQPGFLGPHDGEAKSYKPTVTATGHLVSIAWKGGPGALAAPLVQIDLDTCQVTDSQLSQKLPSCV